MSAAPLAVPSDDAAPDHAAPYVIAALYRFARFADPEAIAAELRTLCGDVGSCGTLIVAGEGINGTVAGSDAAIAALVALPGVGTWTAEIYLKFALGRADVLAAGDLALQEAARMMYGLEARPGPAALRAMSQPWRPWRAVAARGLWAYYRQAKGREGIR